jgi:hypothetical protein
MNNLLENRGRFAGWAASGIAAASLAFSPMLFPAFAAQLGGNAAASTIWPATYTAAGVDRKLAAKFNRVETGRKLAISTGNAFVFTPAGISRGVSRTMTIATRTDSPLSSNAISTRNLTRSIDVAAATGASLNKTDFSLKAARGWQGFKLPETVRLAVKAPVADIAVAAGGFRLDDKTAVRKSRFKTDVKLDKARDAAPSPRGNAAAGEYKVGLESSFSLSRRIDLTAGVRYNSERDRVVPTVDERKDNEAVYVGTKIRF